METKSLANQTIVEKSAAINKWKHGLAESPKPKNFPVLGKLPIDNSQHPEHCHYFIIYAHKGLRQAVGKADYLWKSIEND